MAVLSAGKNGESVRFCCLLDAINRTLPFVPAQGDLLTTPARYTVPIRGAFNSFHRPDALQASVQAVDLLFAVGVGRLLLDHSRLLCCGTSYGRTAQQCDAGALPSRHRRLGLYRTRRGCSPCLGGRWIAARCSRAAPLRLCPSRQCDGLDSFRKVCRNGYDSFRKM